MCILVPVRVLTDYIYPDPGIPGLDLPFLVLPVTHGQAWARTRNEGKTRAF